MAASIDEDQLGEISVRWSGKELKVSGLFKHETVRALKGDIHKQTGVLPERQKLMGIKYKGGQLNDDVVLADLNLTASTKIMMIGTREEEIAQIVEPPTDMPEVINDLDVGDEEVIEISDRSEYLAKVEKRTKLYEFKILNKPREGTKLLVLDVDYTLFDHKSAAESGQQLMRPYLHEFLTTAYSKYDIVIWSATSMKWIEAKMHELGVSANVNYKLCFMLDDLAMITVQTPVYGVIQVKPLGVIWGRFPQWNKTNTIMFDDLRRNFIMNPQNGLKIKPFKNAHTNRSTDNELVGLAQYLSDISDLDDISTLRHDHWTRYKPGHKSSRRKRHKSDH